MKMKYIIGLILALGFIAIAVMSFDSTKIEYADFETARESGKVVQVIGSWDKSENYYYDSEKDEFSFKMIDEEGNSCFVISKGMKPNNFDIAPTVVIKGQFDGDVFAAKDILTKCPSKYEGQFDEMKGVDYHNQQSAN